MPDQAPGINGMTLRTKTLITFLVIAGAAVALIFVAARYILLPRFVALEEHDTQKNLQRVLSALNQDQAALRVITEDWAHWDDTYRFIQDTNPEYIESNLLVDTFVTLDTNLVIYLDDSHEVVFAGAYTADSTELVSVPPSILSQMLSSHSLVELPTTRSSVAGIVMLPEGPMMVASAPITTSEHQGPVRGTLIWGRYLDADRIADMGDKMMVALDAFHADSQNLPPDVTAALADLPDGESEMIRPIDRHEIAGYALLEDVNGQPAVILRARMPRTIYAEGMTAVSSAIAALATIAITMAFLGLLMMERMVLAPVRYLTRSVQKIGAASSRIELPGSDELATLAASINDMLGQLETSQQTLRESEERLRMVVTGAPVILFTVNTEGQFTFVEGKALRALGNRSRPPVDRPPVTAADLPGAAALIERALAGEEIFSTVDYRGLVFEVRALPLRSAAGHITGAIGVATDVTERMAAQEALQETLQNYQRLFERSRDAVFMTARDGTILNMNPAGVELFGWPGSMIGAKAIELYHNRQDRKRYQRTIEADGSVRDYDVTLQKIDGTPIHCLITATVRRAADGSVAGYEGIIRDITAYRQGIVALRESEEQFRSIFEDAPIGMVLADREGRAIESNAAFQQMLGYTAAEMRGMAFRELTYPDDLDDDHALWQELLQGVRSQYTLEKRYIRKTGDPVWVRLRVARFYGGESKSEFVVLMCEDITERRRAEEAEREQRALLEALRDTAAALSSTLDLDEVFDRILSSAAQVVPHDASTIMLIEDGMAHVLRCGGYHNPADRDDVMALSLPVAEAHNLHTMMETQRALVIPDTRSYEGWVDIPGARWIRSVASAPIRMGDEVIGFLNLDSATPYFFSEPHAERLQAFADQAALAIKNARLFDEVVRHAAALEERNQDLDAFSHTVAHDLKSPLQIMIGYANLINADYRNQVSDEIAELMQNIEVYAHKMSRMIESILMLAQLRSAEQAITHVDMRPVVQEAIARSAPAIRLRGVEVCLEGDFPSVRGYGPWLEEVFANFIDNAVKYIGEQNSAPQVTIRGALTDGVVRYEVQDNGIGILPEDQEKLFEMFTRFHRGEAKGSGLGLSIVWRVIRKLNGQVGVESAPGTGSTFWFTLPAAD